MRSRTRSWALALALGASTHACQGKRSSPPSAQLFADPEICDVPCQVVLDSGLEPSQGRDLTFTWNLGAGPVAGGARLLHSFESPGLHEVSVTASDGRSSSTETATVRVEDLPGTSDVIGEAGGTLSQGACTVTVPEGVAPAPVTVELTELPSMVPAAERALGGGRVTALGSAYDVETPMKPSTAVAISVKDAGARGRSAADLAWLVRLVAYPLPPADAHDLVYSPAPLADYVLVPVTSVDEDGTAHGEIYGPRRFQLVRLNERLPSVSVELDGASTRAPPSGEPRPGSPRTSDRGIVSGPESAAAALPPPSPIIVFERNPQRITITDYKNAIVDGLAESRRVLVDGAQFRGPEGAVVVYVGKLDRSDLDAYVAFFDRHVIHLSYALSSTDKVKKVVAHEFFHLIQNHCTNRLSSLAYHYKDGWFDEGTATWAMDEVFDDIRDYYFATPWTRFSAPLLKETTETDALHAYENVAFWKWAEAKNARIIRRILEDRFAMTHSALSTAGTPIENLALVDYLLSMRKIWPDADFLEFAYKARYLKDFDEAETGLGELWSSDGRALGTPKEISYTVGDVVSATSGGSEDNPVTIEFELYPHLTAEVVQVASFDLSGTLHVRFKDPPGPLDARLIVVDRATYDERESVEVRDVSTDSDDLTARLSPSEHAYVFVADPRWLYSTTSASMKVKLQVWIEDPCASLPASVIDVGPEDDLFVALTSAPAGSAVRLAPGTYTPPARDWPTPEYGPFRANVVVRDLTLVGAGESATRLVMTGSPYAGYGFKVYGDATIRNLTIEPRDSEPAFDCLDARKVTLCDVAIPASSTTDYGIIWAPWHGGSSSLRFLRSTLTSPDPARDPIGMLIQSCYDPPAQVTVEIRNSRISGWGEGVSFDNGQCGSVSAVTDCEGFSNNLYYNVVDWNCSGGTCAPTEMCP